jgi:hypothetical protein
MANTDTLYGTIDLTVPEHKKNEEWYKTVIWNYTKAYNQPYYVVPTTGAVVNPIAIIQRNYNYYYTQQSNLRNFFATQGTNLQELEHKNNRIYILVNYLEGKAVEFMNKYNISTEVLSPTCFTNKDLLRNELMLHIDAKEFMEALSILGMYHNNLTEEYALETKEDIDFWFENTFRDYGAFVAEKIAKEIIRRQDYINVKTKQLKDIVIAGYKVTDREIVDGKLMEDYVLPQEAILDLRNPNDNNFNDAAFFRGRFINLCSPYEILERYGDYLDDKAKEEIRNLSISTNNMLGRSFLSSIPASPTGNYDWYMLGGGNFAPVQGMSVVKMYFYAQYDYRNKIRKGRLVKERDYDQNGNPIPQNQNRQGIHMNWRVYQGTLIGGKWLVNYGLCNNAIYSDRIKGKQELPMTAYVHDYTGGYYKSMVSRLIDLQDDIDLCDTKILDKAINEIGVNTIINNTGGDSQTTIKDILADFKSMHMTMLKRDIEENPDMPHTPFAEQVDFTGVLKGIDVYMRWKDMCKQEMGELMHLPNVALGMQNSTIGKGVQQNTVELSSTGLLPLWMGWVQSIQKDLMLSTNMQKLMMLDEDYDQSDAQMIVGDRGMEWLKMTMTEQFNTLGIYINPYDVIDATERAKIDNRAFGYVQNGLLNAYDIEKISSMTSKREVEAYLRYTIAKNIKRNEIMAEQQRKDQMAIAQANMQSRMQEKQIPAQAQVAAAQQRKEATMYSADKAAEAKQRDTDVRSATEMLKNNNQ